MVLLGRLARRRVVPKPFTVAVGLAAAGLLAGWAAAIVPVVRQGSEASWTALQWEQRCLTEWGIETGSAETMARLVGRPGVAVLPDGVAGAFFTGPTAVAAVLDGVSVAGRPVELIGVARGVPAQRPLGDAPETARLPSALFAELGSPDTVTLDGTAGARVVLAVAGTYDGTPAATVADVPLCTARNWIVQTDAFSEDQRGPSIVVPFDVVDAIVGTLGARVVPAAYALAPSDEPRAVADVEGLAAEVLRRRELADARPTGREGAASAAPALARAGVKARTDLVSAIAPLVAVSVVLLGVVGATAGWTWRRARRAELAMLAGRGVPRRWAAVLATVETLVPGVLGGVLGGVGVAVAAGLAGPAPEVSGALAVTGVRWGLVGSAVLVAGVAVVAAAGAGARSLASVAGGAARVGAGRRRERPLAGLAGAVVLVGAPAMALVAAVAAIVAVRSGVLVAPTASGTPQLRSRTLAAFFGACGLAAVAPVVGVLLTSRWGRPGAVRRFPASVLAARRASSLAVLSAVVAFLAAGGATGAGIGSGVSAALAAGSDAKAAVVLGAPSVARTRSQPPPSAVTATVFRTTPSDPDRPGGRITVLGVDPSRFAQGTLPAALPPGARDALARLGPRTADGGVPALVVGRCCPADDVAPAELVLGLDTTLTLSPRPVGSVPWFPGVPRQFVGLVVDVRALEGSPVGGWEAWSRLDGPALRSALEGDDVRVVSVLSSATVLDRAPMRFVGWVAAGVALVGWALVAAAGLSLVLYLAVHARADLASALLLQRGGVGTSVRVRSRLIEATALGVLPAVVGSVIGRVVTGSVVARLDSLPALPPAPGPHAGAALATAVAAVGGLLVVAVAAGVGDAMVSARRSLLALRRDES
jgi:hypothetical protein